MNCPKCNSVVEVGSLFCSNCGMRFDNNGSEGVSVQEPVITNVSQENVNLTNTNNLNSTDVSTSSLVSNETGILNTNINSNVNQVNVSNNTSDISSNISFNTNTGSDMANNGVDMSQNINTNMNMNLVTNNNATSSNISTSPSMVSNSAMGTSIDNPKMSQGNTGTMNSLNKVNRSGNLITIILVLVIAIIAVVVCYLMVSGNKSDATDKNNDTVATNNLSEVTVNGRTGYVPNGWNFVSGAELGTNYESVFLNDTQDSVAIISSATNVTFNDVKNNMYALKAKYEAGGFSDLSVTTNKKNGVEYILFNGILDGYNYHVLYMSDEMGISGSEGPYASSSDLETIVSFVTGLKKSVSIKGNVSESKVKLFDVILEK